LTKAQHCRSTDNINKLPSGSANSRRNFTQPRRQWRCQESQRMSIHRHRFRSDPPRRRICSAVCTAALLLLSTLPGPALAAAGDAAAGKAKSATCSGCHGSNGIAIAPNFPNLAGQKFTYLVNAITAYQTGKRSDPTMMAMVAALSPTDIYDLAAHFSSLPRQ